ncbi:hypothetical protein FA15DRAFT_119811 [Coprinopsis marcescibilis]|uniref:Uncharacterized protein n=1 Tax=Coprinopsis marcescibilis TaxID=230819 RepID=A0A5C3L4F5_COPMA|nr:hypothetical protein FA15DRAFT_119811 [Coprinopsis marcescibilis]
MYRALTRNKFLEVINELARVGGMEASKGHSILIGATLEYLRKHAQILAPYMQAHPAQNEEFIHIVMPGVQRQ